MDVQLSERAMREKIRRCLINQLRERGFAGTFPHFRKRETGYVALLSVQRNRYGHAFTVEMSAFFPDCINRDSNIAAGCALPVNKINVWHTKRRYRLKGMYDGWFYEVPAFGRVQLLLGKVYTAVSEKEMAAYKKPALAWQAQGMDVRSCDQICRVLTAQLKEGFAWLDRFTKEEEKRGTPSVSDAIQ